MCQYPVNRTQNNPWALKLGRQIKVVNGSATLGMVVHVGGISGFPHEADGDVRAPGAAYIKTPTTANQTGEFYCHNPNVPAGTAMKDSGSAGHQFLRIVP